MPSISLPVASYRHRSAPASSSRLVNAFVEQLPPDAKTPFALTRTPGLSTWATVGVGPIQGMHSDHGLLYVVSGGVLFSATSAAVATSRGTVGNSSEIDIDSNDEAVVVVSPPHAFYWNGLTFGQITDTDFTSRGAGDVEFLDNWMLFREPNTGRIFAAELGSVTDFDALDFITAEGHPDTLVGLKADHRQAFLPGEKTCELWMMTTVAGFPLERMEPGFIEIGCANGKTVAKADNSLLWVADDFTVRRLEGLTPTRVSTHAIEQWLQTVTLIALRGYSFSQEGHVYYMLTAPEGCFLYDITTQSWHERATYDETSWNWGNPVRFAGLVLVGSTVDGKIAALDPDIYTEIEETLRMEWTYQPVYVEGVRAFHDRLEMVVETGIGLTSGQGSVPVIMLSFSDDGGITWFNLPDRKLGPLGQRTHRVVWSALGSCASAHGRVYRAAVSDPVKVTVTDTLLSMRGGRL